MDPPPPPPPPFSPFSTSSTNSSQRIVASPVPTTLPTQPPFQHAQSPKPPPPPLFSLPQNPPPRSTTIVHRNPQKRPFSQISGSKLCAPVIRSTHHPHYDDEAPSFTSTTYRQPQPDPTPTRSFTSTTYRQPQSDPTRTPMTGVQATPMSGVQATNLNQMQYGVLSRPPASQGSPKMSYSSSSSSANAYPQYDQIQNPYQPLTDQQRNISLPSLSHADYQQQPQPRTPSPTRPQLSSAGMISHDPVSPEMSLIRRLSGSICTDSTMDHAPKRKPRMKITTERSVQKKAKMKALKEITESPEKEDSVWLREKLRENVSDLITDDDEYVYNVNFIVANKLDMMAWKKIQQIDYDFWTRLTYAEARSYMWAIGYRFYNHSRRHAFENDTATGEIMFGMAFHEVEKTFGFEIIDYSFDSRTPEGIKIKCFRMIEQYFEMRFKENPDSGKLYFAIPVNTESQILEVYMDFFTGMGWSSFPWQEEGVVFHVLSNKERRDEADEKFRLGTTCKHRKQYQRFVKNEPTEEGYEKSVSGIIIFDDGTTVTSHVKDFNNRSGFKLDDIWLLETIDLSAKAKVIGIDTRQTGLSVKFSRVYCYCESVSDLNDWISCETFVRSPDCKIWYHPTCLTPVMPSKTYERLSKSSEKWICPVCKLLSSVVSQDTESPYNASQDVSPHDAASQGTSQDAAPHDSASQDADSHDAVMQDAVLHDAILQDITLPDTVLHDTVSQDTVSQDAASQDVVSQDAVSQDVVSQDVVSQDDVSQDAVSQDAVSQDSVSQDSVSQDSVSQDSVSQDDVSQDAVSQDAVSQDAASQDAVSQDAVSQDAVSQDTVSDDAVSPDAASPDAASPDAASPDAASPDAASPDAVSQDAVSQDAASQEHILQESESQEANPQDTSSANGAIVDVPFMDTLLQDSESQPSEQSPEVVTQIDTDRQLQSDADNGMPPLQSC